MRGQDPVKKHRNRAAGLATLAAACAFWAVALADPWPGRMFAWTCGWFGSAALGEFCYYRALREMARETERIRRELYPDELPKF